MTHRLSTDPSLFQMDRIHEWLAGSYWSPRIRRDVVDRAFSNSIAIGAYDDAGVQVGVARAVTDQATFVWVCDVFVSEAARGQGIARAMVRGLMADPRLQTARRWCLATLDAHEVYRKLGYGPVNADRWMELMPPESTWQDG